MTGEAAGAGRLGWLVIPESIAWGVILGHVIHWAVDALYYIFLQVRYGFQGFSLWVQAPYGQRWYIGTPGHSKPFTLWYLKDAWDKAPEHISNLLGTHWFRPGQVVPGWWITDRHDARFVVIDVLTGVVVFFLAAKPRKNRESYSWFHMATTPIRAIVYAIPGVILGALLIWKIQWLHTGGFTAPASWGIAGNEITQWSGTGKLALLLLGLLGTWLFARFASLGPADEAQWLYAQQRANRVLRERKGRLAAVGNIADSIVVGLPGYRRRVRELVARGVTTKSTGILMRLTLRAFLVATLALAGYGAWITLAGPAAGA